MPSTSFPSGVANPFSSTAELRGCAGVCAHAWEAITTITPARKRIFTVVTEHRQALATGTLLSYPGRNIEKKVEKKKCATVAIWPRARADREETLTSAGFLSPEAQRAVQGAVTDAEAATSAEIVVAVRRLSGHYRDADYLFG